MLIWKLFPVEKRLRRAPLHIVMGQYAHDHPHLVVVDRCEVLECARDPSSYFLHLALRQSPPSCCFFSSWRPTSMHTSSCRNFQSGQKQGRPNVRLNTHPLAGPDGCLHAPHHEPIMRFLALSFFFPRLLEIPLRKSPFGNNLQCSHSEVSLSVLLFTSSPITRRKTSVFAHMTFRKIPLHSS